MWGHRVSRPQGGVTAARSMRPQSAASVRVPPGGAPYNRIYIHDNHNRKPARPQSAGPSLAATAAIPSAHSAYAYAAPAYAAPAPARPARPQSAIVRGAPNHLAANSKANAFRKGAVRSANSHHFDGVATGHSWTKHARDKHLYAQRANQRRDENIRRTTHTHSMADGKKSKEQKFMSTMDKTAMQTTKYWAPVGGTMHIAHTPDLPGKTPTPANAASKSQFGLDSQAVRRIRKAKHSKNYTTHSMVQPPLYITSSHVHGVRAPMQLEIQREYHAGSNVFSKSFNGLRWRDVGFNTTLDKSRTSFH